MVGTNQTTMTEFFLLGFSNYPNLEIALFLLCLPIFLVILLGNIILIVINVLDSHLHTPMYFFLSNLSLLDICFTSSFFPLMLVNFLSAQKTIFFFGCTVQMFASLAMGSTECILLAMMAYDRYVAICNPLRYPIIMNKRLCVSMTTGSWVLGCFNSLLQTVLVLKLPFCGQNTIDHFACEILAVLKLMCADISLNELTLMIGSVTIVFTPLLLICVSYVCILSSILRITSAKGRHKAFSACSAHLGVVLLFYGASLFMYMKPKKKDVAISDEVISLSYGAVTPMLNPIIYSLRNKEVKEAVRKLLSHSLYS
ncbi:olfactory receptor 13D1-like [Tachyglossus aculeatus]|uniref:olfactory receptor 13D1-like n=1 Tax=Tachyglossus aculeatus TaxID=9261 RepID=UPI0018F41786|nr:olfactory receptor 13D1-like [Tachyglossus aculeatus]